MNNLEQYAESFRRGLYRFLYTDEGNCQMPMMNKGSLASIGYYDGYQYGEYLEITGQTMSISDEHLMAVIDKCHTQAFHKYKENETRYLYYKNGFINGKSAILEKIIMDDETVNQLPVIDYNNLESIGYYDGYSYFLNDFIQNGIVNQKDDSTMKLEEISRTFFNQRENDSMKEKGQSK